MPKYVAFLRAINVGGHTVKMNQLRDLFAALNFSNVETFIASGNVIFDARTPNTKALEKKIEKHLAQALGYEVKTFVRSASDLARIAAYQPFTNNELNAEGNTLFIAFVADELSAEISKKMTSLTTAIDAFRIHGREVYWLYRRQAGESKYYGALLEKSLGAKATVRNSTTIKKLAAKLVAW